MPCQQRPALLPRACKNLSRRRSAVALLAFFSFAAACTKPQHALSTEEHRQQVEQWFEDRINKLMAEDGWLTLVGLLPLPEGESTFGTDDGSDLVFPGDAGDGVRFGTFVRTADAIEVHAAQGDWLRHEEEPITTMVLHTDQPGPATVLSAGDLRFFVIQRGERVLIRIRNPESRTRREFAGIERFPVDQKWHVVAEFELRDDGVPLAVPNILGDIDQEVSPGTVHFSVDGQDYSLDALEGDASGNLFFVFGDLTNGKTTYGGGRFLYSAVPDADGSVVLDFNRAYNPPCVFTPFATCPLPPRQNRLPVDINAGERGFANH
jgi:uncharacterized protein (DUF1684 family)